MSFDHCQRSWSPRVQIPMKRKSEFCVLKHMIFVYLNLIGSKKNNKSAGVYTPTCILFVGFSKRQQKNLFCEKSNSKPAQ